MRDLWKYFKEVLKHKWFVLKFGIQIGGIPFCRLIVHDWTKFLPCEYRVYIKRYVHNACPEDEWKVAWLHHLNHNPHHWEHWVLKGEALQMPETYIREMVADWMAVGASYPGADSIQVWLGKKAEKMNLYPLTIQTLCRILNQHGIIWPLKGN
jgi:hypothetical protein